MGAFGALVWSAFAVLCSAALVYSYALFVWEGAWWLLAAPRYRWGRALGVHQAELSVSLVYAPLFSGLAAVLAGLGVNVVTDSDASTVDRKYGMALVGLALLGLAYSSLTLLKNSKGRGLPRVRYQIHRYTDRAYTPPDIDAAVAWIKRQRRAGQYLADQGAALTWRRYRRRRRTLVSVTASAVSINLVFVVAVAVRLIAVGTGLATRSWIVIGLIALALPLASLGLVLDWRTQRWWLRTVGQELIEAADRAQASIARRFPEQTLRRRLGQWWRDRPRYRGQRRTP
ncbi:hypothetical protein ABZ914_19980 [Spirillospora sp. NPDC046719]